MNFGINKCHSVGEKHGYDGEDFILWGDLCYDLHTQEISCKTRYLSHEKKGDTTCWHDWTGAGEKAKQILGINQRHRVSCLFVFKTQHVIRRFSHFHCFKHVWIKCWNNQNPSLVDVRLKMGLEPVLLPQGISHWSAGSGTSCSLCHQDIVLRNKWLVHRRNRKHVIPPTDYSMCWAWAIRFALFSQQQKYLWHFMLCVMHSPPVDLCPPTPHHPVLLCCHGDPQRGMGARRKLGLNRHVSLPSSHQLCPPKWKKTLWSPQTQLFIGLNCCVRAASSTCNPHR